MDNPRFKFRYWHEADKKMVYRPNERDFPNEGGLINGILSSDDVVWMQYYGRDTNMLNIFEGDIVLFTTHVGASPIDDEKGIISFDNEYNCLCVKTINDDYPHLLYTIDVIKVIGNIYETPELLT